MTHRFFHLFLLILFFQAAVGLPHARAQQKKKENWKSKLLPSLNVKSPFHKDSLDLSVHKDSAQIAQNGKEKSQAFYDSLRSMGSKSKLASRAIDWLLVAPSGQANPTEDPRSNQPYYEQFEGWTIVEVRFKSVPIFDGDVSDTTKKKHSFVGRVINPVHLNTQRYVLKRNLLLHKGDKVDAYRLMENERLLRSLSFIEDARFYLKPIAYKQAALIIITKDRFQLSADGDFSSLQKYDLSLHNNNIAGTGNELSTSYFHNDRPGRAPIDGWALNYRSNFISNDFYNAELWLANNWKEQGVKARLSKQFVSTSIKWGGAIEGGHWQNLHQLTFPDTAYDRYVGRDYVDIWSARSFEFPDGKAPRNIALAGRMTFNRFYDRPTVSEQYNQRYHDRNEYLVSASFYQREFYRGKNILTIGITEDVPVGVVFAGTLGKEFGEYRNRWYSGLQFSYGFLKPQLGYFLFSYLMGNFWDGGEAVNGALKLKGGYFSPYQQMAVYGTRLFGQLQLSRGIKLDPIERFNLVNQIRGYDGRPVISENNVTGSVENVWYTPWITYGFRFAPMAFYDWGYANDTMTHQFISSAGIGCRVVNQSFTIRTLQFRASYLPHVVGDGSHWTFQASIKIPVMFNQFRPIKPYIISYGSHFR